MVACSKDDKDEPTGKENNKGNQIQGTENDEIISDNHNNEDLSNKDDKEYIWSVSFNEIAGLLNGYPEKLNISKECLSWKEKYEKYFSVINLGGSNMYSWETDLFSDYSFNEIDQLLVNYVSFTLYDRSGEKDPGYVTDFYSAGATNLSENNLSLLHLTYNPIHDFGEIIIADNWLAEFHISNPLFLEEVNDEWYEIVKEWINNHQDNLDYLDEKNYSGGWIFNLENFNEDYLKNEIYPFLEFSMYNQLSFYVVLYEKDVFVQRQFGINRVIDN